MCSNSQGYYGANGLLPLAAASSAADGPAVPESREPASVVGDPSDEELLELWQGWNLGWDPQKGTVLMPHPAEYARAVLARYGQQPAPVPVAERLPGPEDCDAEGRCWLFSKVEKEWRLIDAGNPGVPHLKYCFSHWLPATALPLPAKEVEP